MLWFLSPWIMPDEPEVLNIHVESQVTSERLVGASVRVGAVRYIADERGEITINPVQPGTMVIASAEGHETLQREVPEPGDGELTLSLPGVLVVGKLVDAISDRPVEGAEVTVAGLNGEPIASSHTDEYGRFIFKFIPEHAKLEIRDEVYGEITQPIEISRDLIIALDPPPVSGRVVDTNGMPVQGVAVYGVSTSTQTDSHGRFQLEGVGQGSEISLQVIEAEVTVVVDGRDMGDISIPANDYSEATPESGVG